MIYLDYGATSPLRQEAYEAMLPFWHQEFGNPGSLHNFGQNSHETIIQARKTIANSLGAKSAREIIFTSSGTESNNLAIIGAARRNKHRGQHLITSQIEHPSVLETCRFLEQEGFQVTYLPVDREGFVQIKDVKAAIRPDTVLISIMAANNETGTLQPIYEIGQLTKQHTILFHTDAVQFYGKIPFSVQELPIDLLSIGSHKIYGPKGVGALYIRRGVRIDPLLFGGGQERELRPSTLPTPLIVGFAAAAKAMTKEVAYEEQRLSNLRDYCFSQIQQEIENVELNGHPQKRLPGNINLSFEGIEGQAVLLELNREEIYISSGSACSAGKHAASHVLMAMGRNEEIAHQSLRITFGRQTTKNDIDILVNKLKSIIGYFRSMKTR
ncbi:cysteine desulfurase [Seinonella peptonophila]|uniref:Cysteine desulfurase n=1 Tax=Seinonella peptonophila TaxID=112248 RepID=A0A1M5A7C9_9BACL|nr:cysteine desulfurase family protein [Seinonella peptonophila]SHF26218.1 cysteine desulfurase [Seinonella peptonophila]